VGETGIPRILHLHSGFNLGGKEARAVRLMNVWGRRAHHSVISADHAAMGARKAIAADVPCDFPMEAAPSLNGLPGLARYRRWARYMQRFDLVLTYNWGAMDGVMAHRMFAPFVKLPPLIHHEDGFNEDEAERLKPKRNLFRQLALGSAHALVVPSRVLEDVALGAWAQPRPRIRRIANGIDVAAYAVPPAPGAIPGLGKRAGDVVVGTLAGLRAVKNLPRLVRVVASLGEHVWLAIVGEGPEREAIVAQARALGMEQRLILPGFLPDPARYIGSFDIFALSSDSEQAPISLIEAMAAGRPAVSTDVGDVRNMVADENAALIVPRNDETRFEAALRRLVESAELRATIGAANRRKAQAEFQESTMLARYGALYEGAMGRPGALNK
jgi:glycosyltransferase involved in cell wall biosynthesis